MRVDVMILGGLAVAASAGAMVLWRANRKNLRRLASLTAQCEKAESENASLARALSLRAAEEDERFSRLEHDLKSPLGVILGFSSLLLESIEPNPIEAAGSRKSITAIHKAATKILEIVDARSKSGNSHKVGTTSYGNS